MKDFHRKLLAARLEGHGAEMRFWADYAEDRGYRGAERLRAVAGACGVAPSTRFAGPPSPLAGQDEGGAYA